MTVQVGLPDNILQENYVNQFYNQLSVQKLDFFININHAILFAIDYSQNKLKSKKEEYGLVFNTNIIVLLYYLILY